jgi:folate-dependent phosphoribosylglycinamide formyltransferase PurN
LTARILEREHEVYIEALKLVVTGEYQVVGRRVLRKNRPG